MGSRKNMGRGLIAGSAALMALSMAILTGFEGRHLRAYHDIVGVATICDGETKGVVIGDVATPAECDAMLRANIVRYERALDQCLIVPVPPKTKIALVSWAYNVGPGAACRSTLVRKANAGDLRGACDELLRWNRAGGRVVRGLSLRRASERDLCLAGLE